MHKMYIYILISHSVSYFIPIIHGQLIIKPSEPIVLRDQFRSFVASCTGQPNTRVGSLKINVLISSIDLFSFSLATWRSPLQIDIVEDDTARYKITNRLRLF